MVLRTISSTAEGSKFCCTTADSIRAVSYTHLDVYKRQLQEIVGAEVGPDVDALVDGHGLVHRHAAQRDHTVHVLSLIHI